MCKGKCKQAISKSDKISIFFYMRLVVPLKYLLHVYIVIIF